MESQISDFVDIHVAVHDGVDGEGGDALHAEFLHDVLTVGDNGRDPDIQFVGNLLVDVTLYDERHDFYLAVSE